MDFLLGLFSNDYFIIEELQMRQTTLEWSYILLMTLLGAMIIIAWGNFIRNYILRWLIAMVVYYMPTNKEIDFTMMTIIEFFTTGLSLRVQGEVLKTALLVPVSIHVLIREIFVYDIDATEPFFSVTLPKPIMIGSKNIHLDQDLEIKILKNERFQEFACRLILGMKLIDIRIEGNGDFDFGLLKVSNLALKKYIYLSKFADRPQNESKIIPNMTFKPMPVLPSLYVL
jgi:hypothetical protein